MSEHMTITHYIPVGRENAIPRARLCELTGLPDRKMRREIEAARHDGALILNRQDGNGYYIVGPDDLDELERQYWQDTDRAMSILARRKHERRILKDAGREVRIGKRK